MGMNTEVAHSIGTAKSVSKFRPFRFRPFRIQGINVGKLELLSFKLFQSELLTALRGPGVAESS
jgi:hypothetical protein